ncbi:MAG: hypothetical protein GY950_03090 [bacterium]|nr:hypothetical protein [bacterium]
MSTRQGEIVFRPGNPLIIQVFIPRITGKMFHLPGETVLRLGTSLHRPGFSSYHGGGGFKVPFFVSHFYFS